MAPPGAGRMEGIGQQMQTSTSGYSRSGSGSSSREPILPSALLAGIHALSSAGIRTSSPAHAPLPETAPAMYPNLAHLLSTGDAMALQQPPEAELLQTSGPLDTLSTLLMMSESQASAGGGAATTQLDSRQSGSSRSGHNGWTPVPAARQGQLQSSAPAPDLGGADGRMATLLMSELRRVSDVRDGWREGAGGGAAEGSRGQSSAGLALVASAPGLSFSALAHEAETPELASAADGHVQQPVTRPSFFFPGEVEAAQPRRRVSAANGSVSTRADTTQSQMPSAAPASVDVLLSTESPRYQWSHPAPRRNSSSRDMLASHLTYPSEMSTGSASATETGRLGPAAPLEPHMAATDAGAGAGFSAAPAGSARLRLGRPPEPWASAVAPGPAGGWRLVTLDESGRLVDVPPPMPGHSAPADGVPPYWAPTRPLGGPDSQPPYWKASLPLGWADPTSASLSPDMPAGAPSSSQSIHAHTQLPFRIAAGGAFFADPPPLPWAPAPSRAQPWPVTRPLEHQSFSAAPLQPPRPGWSTSEVLMLAGILLVLVINFCVLLYCLMLRFLILEVRRRTYRPEL